MALLTNSINCVLSPSLMVAALVDMTSSMRCRFEVHSSSSAAKAGAARNTAVMINPEIAVRFI
ncbi:hypothetical protein D3C81_2304150 [compost metagenome]